MPSAQIIFGNKQESGDSTLAGASPLAVNVLIDGKGAVRRRPGLSAWDGFPAVIPTEAQIDGIHEFQGDVYFVNENREVARVVTSTATVTNLSASGGATLLAGTGRPVFAETLFRLVIAGGAEMQKVDVGAAAAARLGGSPPPASQVIALASRLFCNDVTPLVASLGKIRASGVGQTAEETWDPLSVVSAEARPDAIVALKDNANEAFAWGSTTLQVFSPDATSLLAPGRTINRGIAAADSIIQNDENLSWLSELLSFVTGDGRSINVLSDPIAATLSDITSPTDCWGFRLNIDQFDVLVWVFPTDGRTFAYQQGGGWSQWHSSNAQGLTPFIVTAHHLLTPSKVHLAGLATGQIAKFDATASTDLGLPIIAKVATGHQNHGTDRFKCCEVLRLTFKRGQATTAEPFVLLTWRDDLGDYEDTIRVGLGVTGDTIFTVELRSLGTYRARDWLLEFTGAEDFVLARAEETFTVEQEDA